MKRETSNLIKMVATIVVASVLTSSFAYADAGKGQKLYSKKLKKACGVSGAKMAGTHTQDEWEEIRDEGRLLEEIQKQCPKVKGVKEKYLPHLYDFFHQYGSDSGNVPSC
ncbi:MAG: cytochrome C [Campylobacterota bacterium]|nr:cytochrome C [Campylobacterota bacterium]